MNYILITFTGTNYTIRLYECDREYESMLMRLRMIDPSYEPLTQVLNGVC